MKLTTKLMRSIVSEAVRSALAEAKAKDGKKKKKDDGRTLELPGGYTASEPLDFARAQGDRNFIKAAGAANFGPYTGEDVVRFVVGNIIREQLGLRPKKMGRR